MSSTFKQQHHKDKLKEKTKKFIPRSKVPPLAPPPDTSNNNNNNENDKKINNNNSTTNSYTPGDLSKLFDSSASGSNITYDYSSYSSNMNINHNKRKSLANSDHHLDFNAIKPEKPPKKSKLGGKFSHKNAIGQIKAAKQKVTGAAKRIEEKKLRADVINNEKQLKSISNSKPTHISQQKRNDDDDDNELSELSDDDLNVDDVSDNHVVELSKAAKREKRLKEDAEFDKSPTSKADINKQRKLNIETDERAPRTLFIGNVPTSMERKSFQHWLESHLSTQPPSSTTVIESVRYRSISVSDPTLPKHIAIKKHLFHDNRNSLHAYVVIKQSDQTEQYMKKAVELNGIHLNHQDNTYILRIDYVDDRKSVNDYDRSVFVGNLSFAINENEVYKFFENCGEIENVRIVRDPTNNIGKGIAFVTFKSKDSIKNALTFHNTKFGDRLLRVMKAVQNKKIHNSGTNSSRLKNSNSNPSKSSSATSSRPTSHRHPLSDRSTGAREGYGNKSKYKELNQAGVLKKPRHTPRTDTTKKNEKINKKRSFEGERSEPGKIQSFKKHSKKNDFKNKKAKTSHKKSN